MRLKKPGPAHWFDMKVVACERPETTVEESVSAEGRRRDAGYLPARVGAWREHRILFRLEWLQAPRSDGLGLRRLADLSNNRWKEEAR